MRDGYNVLNCPRYGLPGAREWSISASWSAAVKLTAGRDGPARPSDVPLRTSSSVVLRAAVGPVMVIALTSALRGGVVSQWHRHVVVPQRFPGTTRTTPLYRADPGPAGGIGD
jgi:hypothetical protein